MKKIFNTKSSTPQKAFTQKAFTLLELLVVIAVLGILAVAIITALNPVKKTNQAKDSSVKSDINQIANALQAYLTSKNPPVYPATLEGLAPDEIKTVPKQQKGNKGCLTAEAADTTDYCYTNPVGANVAVWGVLFDVTTRSFWCWDSSGIFKVSTAAVAGQTTCP